MGQLENLTKVNVGGSAKAEYPGSQHLITLSSGYLEAKMLFARSRDPLDSLSLALKSAELQQTAARLILENVVFPDLNENPLRRKVVQEDLEEVWLAFGQMIVRHTGARNPSKKDVLNNRVAQEITSDIKRGIRGIVAVSFLAHGKRWEVHFPSVEADVHLGKDVVLKRDSIEEALQVKANASVRELSVGYDSIAQAQLVVIPGETSNFYAIKDLGIPNTSKVEVFEAQMLASIEQRNRRRTH